MVQVINENETIKIKSDYNADFVAKARMLQGKWEKPYWVFPAENIIEVKSVLADVYGYVDEAEAGTAVDIEIDMDKFHFGDEVRLGNMLVATRHSRDGMVTLSANAMCTKGGFKRSGGSARYPAVTAEDGTVIKVKKIPLSIYEQVKDEQGIRLVGEVDKESLLVEKEKLIARLSEIEKMLK